MEPVRSLPNSRTTSEKAVTGIADVNDVAETELAPLYEAVDPDALDSLLRSSGIDRVEFTHCGCLVSIYADGRVDVEPHGESAE